MLEMIDQINHSMSLKKKMKTTKNIPFNKTQVIVNKDTFDTMERIVKESKK